MHFAFIVYGKLTYYFFWCVFLSSAWNYATVRQHVTQNCGKCYCMVFCVFPSLLCLLVLFDAFGNIRVHLLLNKCVRRTLLSYNRPSPNPHFCSFHTNSYPHVFNVRFVATAPAMLCVWPSTLFLLVRLLLFLVHYAFCLVSSQRSLARQQFYSEIENWITIISSAFVLLCNHVFVWFNHTARNSTVMSMV